MNYNMIDEIDYLTNITDNNKLDLFSPYEGYLKGNLFKNLYNTYKNYKPQKLKINNEQKEMLLNIGQLSFARHELNLLLDNYPNNREAIDLFNRYLKIEEDEKKNYERKYGPLEITSFNTSIPFAWENTKWPWDL